MMTLVLLLILFIVIIITPYSLAEGWTITVYTGRKRFAGTDSNVYIRLFDSQGESTDEYQLTHRNWIRNKHEIPVRNLFEMGARERFFIDIDNIKSIAKIQIRHDNFPSFQSDWLLDQVVVERNQDRVKYVFKCNCWLRKEHPLITLSPFPDPRSIDKNRTNDSFSKNNRIFVIILLLLISLLMGIFCCFNEYRRRQRHSLLSLPATTEHMQREQSLLDACHSQTTPRSPSPSFGPQSWINTFRQWKTSSHQLPSYNRAQSTTAAHTASRTIPVDEPPSYEDLYPNSTTLTNNVPNLNS